VFKRSLVSVVVAYFSTTGLVAAQTERDLDSHEHGAASINLVIDGSSLFVELESPWNNLVGFEHAPSTGSQHDAVDAALDTLAVATNIFAINDAAMCKVSSETVESTLDADGDHEEHDEHKDEHDDEHAEHEEHKDEHGDEHAEHDEHEEHKDEHGDEHAEHDEHEEHKDEHGDEHAEHDEHEEHKDEHDEHAEHEHADHGDEATHSEVIAMYSFECENPDKLDSVQVNLFDLFDGFEAIEIQAAGPSGQTGASIDSSMTSLDLSAVR